MRFVPFATVVLMASLVLGCGPRETKKAVQQAPPQDQVRSTLQQVAETGVVDSGLMVVREQLEAMKSTDAAKAEGLLQDLDQLEGMANQPEQAKTKAQEMLGKL